MILTNAFSLNMITDYPVFITVVETSLDQVKKVAPSCISAVGHADTAAVFSSVLGTTVQMNRTTVALKKGDSILVGQYFGPRLPVGATALPEGATIKWLLVCVS